MTASLEIEVRLPSPVASVVLVASESRASIEHVFSLIKGQCIAPRLELVVAAPLEHVGSITSMTSDPLFALKVVPADLATSATARAEAVRHASAEIVIFAEDHAFPVGDNWARRMVEGHARGYAAVGPLVRNGNPATALSWANHTIEYGPWMHAETEKDVEALPGHNSSYRRDILLSYGNDLPAMLEAEWVLHRDMRRRGHLLLLDPAAVIEHLNFSRFGRSMSLQFYEGWMFAASRARRWSLFRRGLYAASFPAIAAVRFVRAIAHLRQSPDYPMQLPAAVPHLSLLLGLNAFGEALGYAFGDCDQRERLAYLEYARWRNILPNEIHLTR